MTYPFDEILEHRKKGSLKIYLGYAAGVGKSYAMLQEGQRLKARGFDVVIGLVDLHEGADFASLAHGLEVVATRFHTVGDSSRQELDVVDIIQRKPQVVLVDDLAHTNAPGLKNEKRYQDVLDLLESGISVISTLNVQHLDSVAEKLSVCTKTAIADRVPDLILKQADQVVTVDLSIEDLRERIRTQKVFKADQTEAALSGFYSHANLALLRETALKEAAGDQVRRIDEGAMLSHQAAQLSHEAVMVCVSSDPTDAEVLIRRGTKMAVQLSSHCYVVYVQRRVEAPTAIDSVLQKKLENNLALAKRLGAEVVVLQGNGISDTLANFATENNVRHAVFGKSRLSPLKERLRGSVISTFVYDAVGVDVHILSPTEGEKV